MTTTFESFGLSETLNKSLSAMNYSAPTPIQEKAIPLALQGRDILGSAQTGTGKTAAFSIPLVEALIRSPQGTALVLTPTRELAKQVLTVIHQLLGHQSNIKTAFIIGGEPMGKQFTQLRARPRIIVGTPGRINDHLERGTIKLNEAGFLVLDETDRMLDMGFGVQLDKILKFLPAKRQTLMFSATLPKGIVELSGKYLNNPERISVGATNKVAMNITQDVIRIDQDKKYKELVSQLHERKGTVIIFVKTKHNADRMAQNLCRDGFEADALHGDLRQRARDKVMREFRSQTFRIMVATDIAARGLDVPHIEHVVNYDLPQVAEDYIHRMGRTARAGAQGSALCFISPQDMMKWRAIERLINPEAARENGNHQGANTNNRSKSFHKRRPERKPFEKRGSEGASRDAGGRDYAKKEGGYKERSSGENANRTRSQKWKENGHSAERTSEGRNFKSGENRSADNRTAERKPSDFRNSDFKKPENRNADSRPFERKKSDFKKPDFRNSDRNNADNRNPEGRSSEGRSADNRNFDRKRSDFKKPEGRNTEGRPTERKNSEGKKFGNRSPDFKSGERKNNDGRNAENKTGGEKKFGGGSKPPFKKKTFSGKPRPKFAA